MLWCMYLQAQAAAAAAAIAAATAVGAFNPQAGLYLMPNPYGFPQGHFQLPPSLQPMQATQGQWMPNWRSFWTVHVISH